MASLFTMHVMENSPVCVCSIIIYTPSRIMLLILYAGIKKVEYGQEPASVELATTHIHTLPSKNIFHRIVSAPSVEMECTKFVLINPATYGLAQRTVV